MAYSFCIFVFAIIHLDGNDLCTIGRLDIWHRTWSSNSSNDGVVWSLSIDFYETKTETNLISNDIRTATYPLLAPVMMTVVDMLSELVSLLRDEDHGVISYIIRV
jgi:hypothetical protein